jgi:hypothetical protein
VGCNCAHRTLRHPETPQCLGLINADALIHSFVWSGIEIISEKSGNNMKMEMKDVLATRCIIVLTH